MAPDLHRCEAEHLEGSFMTLGPRSMVRCPHRPTYVVSGSPFVRGLTNHKTRGQMSMCAECFAVYRQVAVTPYTWVRLLKVHV